MSIQVDGMEDVVQYVHDIKQPCFGIKDSLWQLFTDNNRVLYDQIDNNIPYLSKVEGIGNVINSDCLKLLIQLVCKSRSGLNAVFDKSEEDRRRNFYYTDLCTIKIEPNQVLNDFWNMKNDLYIIKSFEMKVQNYSKDLYHNPERDRLQNKIADARLRIAESEFMKSHNMNSADRLSYRFLDSINFNSKLEKLGITNKKVKDSNDFIKEKDKNGYNLDDLEPAFENLMNNFRALTDSDYEAYDIYNTDAENLFNTGDVDSSKILNEEVLNICYNQICDYFSLSIDGINQYILDNTVLPAFENYLTQYSTYKKFVSSNN